MRIEREKYVRDLALRMHNGMAKITSRTWGCETHAWASGRSRRRT